MSELAMPESICPRCLLVIDIGELVRPGEEEGEGVQHAAH